MSALKEFATELGRMKPNPNWRTPEHNEVVGAGMMSGARFIDIYDDGIRNTRRFWNFDTPEDDMAREIKLHEMEAKIRKGAFWNGV